MLRKYSRIPLLWDESGPAVWLRSSSWRGKGMRVMIGHDGVWADWDECEYEYELLEVTSSS